MRRTIPLAALALALPLGLSACGSFDSAGSGEALITSYMHHVVKDEPVTLRQLHVGCPSGKPNTVGTSYDCTIYAVLVHNGARRGVRGTVTVHVEKGNKVGFVPTHDMHIHQL